MKNITNIHTVSVYQNGFVLGISGYGQAFNEWDKDCWSWGVRDESGILLESYVNNPYLDIKRAELFKRMIIDCKEDFNPSIHILTVKRWSDDFALYFLGYRGLGENIFHNYFFKTVDELLTESKEVEGLECNRKIEHFRIVYKKRVGK
ncbi:hypothetical protein [Pseudoruminococcus massiliensis]|uniref:hypothetical protein n=1 Tax=Pseudoruminococcus massiliensis TaxID=2086583 RepID=UPI003FD7A043